MAEVLSIRTARALARDAVKSYRWEVLFTNPPAVVIPFILNLHYRVRAAELPDIENTAYPTSFGPYELVHPGKRKYSHQYAVRFEEGHSSPAWPGIDAWNRFIFDEYQARGANSGYGTNMWMRLLGQEGEGIEFVEAIHLYNVWPTRVAKVPLAYESEDILTFETVFAYDFWRWEPWPF